MFATGYGAMINIFPLLKETRLTDMFSIFVQIKVGHDYCFKVEYTEGTVTSRCKWRCDAHAVQNL